jgi:hypothetical protein
MIYAEFYSGQGLGNQLWTYVSLRCIAEELSYDWKVLGENRFKGSDFIVLDGVDLKKCEESDLNFPPGYQPKGSDYYLEKRKYHPYYLCDVSGFDEDVLSIDDETKIDGYFQSENLIKKYKKEIQSWIKLKKILIPNVDYDNTLVLNIRGGEYKGNPTLLLRKKYWKDVIEYFRNQYEIYDYVVVTDDQDYAASIFGKDRVLNLNIEQCYSVLTNAKYLGLSNSSFAFFPVWLSDNATQVIAPKYWARHNISNGFWCRSDNIYERWNYMSKKGVVSTSYECLDEYHNSEHESGYIDKVDFNSALYKVRMKIISILYRLGLGS